MSRNKTYKPSSVTYASDLLLGTRLTLLWNLRPRLARSIQALTSPFNPHEALRFMYALSTLFRKSVLSSYDVVRFKSYDGRFKMSV
uniref:Uncharacterized protein n=1 Tax=Picea glauca TaxID=3330 RepID=A0A101M4T7_PICGL|nr:hypothetical protein ABT39_MTgene829 [Picea glauca]QHR87151.1 hypothetical protein Q903MT_gene1160 [Picea sitchensis]